ncbi:MAG: cysteine hydrolase [Sulfobacillus benefaciens]|uniref:Cysteine hydrolase n=1 Tax=Sulfobacillus benefaciens TaxID=453960 RepID=A0A2T2WQ14_9FIRM|nr:MAG: cysteine hydrolase [Sulfobacillus benefaciens]
MVYHRTIPVTYGLPALILVDQQVGGGGIPCSAFEDAMHRTIPLLTMARSRSLPVVHLQEVHRPELVDFGRELDGDEGIHDMEGDQETELFPPLKPIAGEFHVVKRRYSGFFGTDLDLLLRSIGVETLILAGQLTDVCVHYTAIDAHQYNYVVRVAEDCVAGSSKSAHDAALQAIEYHQHGAIRESQEIIDALAGYVPEKPWQISSRQDLWDQRWFLQSERI